MYTVLLADDQAIFRDSAREVIQASGQFHVIAEAADGSDALRMYRECSPDLVVMDVQMEHIDGFRATRLIMGDQPSARVILLSMQDHPEYYRESKETGALGFLPKHGLSANAIKGLLENNGLEPAYLNAD